jgi:hypothetical protein
VSAGGLDLSGVEQKMGRCEGHLSGKVGSVGLMLD